tara:strand:- start:9352 stop:9546 length:195 start_codon:yes stop_codon:yes gene_type:complete
MEPRDIENPIAEADFRHQLREEKRVLDLSNVSKSEVFEHYGKPFTSGRDLWDFLTANYNFTKKT